MKKISRRQFLTLCAGAALLGGGGWAFSRGRILPGLREKAEAVLGGEKVQALRQVVARDNAASRTMMWQSPVRLSSPAVQLSGGKADGKTFPAKEELFTDDGVSAYLYTAQVTGLAGGTTQKYRVSADGASGGWHTLTTDDGGAFRALIFPDSQSNDYTDWKQLAQNAAERNPDASFFVNMGDLVDNGEDHGQWRDWFDAVNGILDRIPVAPLMGNHETYNQQWKVREPVAYLRYFAVPENGNAEDDRRYYSFDYGPVHFTVLDTQQEEEKEAHPELLSRQQAWFREDVRSTDKPWKVVLMHKDPLQYRIHNRPERAEGFSDEGKAWMPLFDAAGVDLVLSAHLHTYRNRGHIQNFQRSENGPLYLLTGVAGNVRYPGLWVDHALDTYVAPQPETDNYLTLDADPHALTVRCFLPDGRQIDEASIQK
ncbi:MAG: metallophosphoesterase family protein [Selenomonadaceae bacterium]|nr:metallophosphoesterase family protein [Selenomonadaceae bacterium]